MAAAQTEQDVDKEVSPMTFWIRALTEFSSVLFQLVCFSRLGPKDYYYLVNLKSGLADYDNTQLEPSLTANFVLFVTLVIFQFPFMNGYIVFMYDMCVIGRTSVWRVLKKRASLQSPNVLRHPAGCALCPQTQFTTVCCLLAHTHAFLEHCVPRD